MIGNRHMMVLGIVVLGVVVALTSPEYSGGAPGGGSGSSGGKGAGTINQSGLPAGQFGANRLTNPVNSQGQGGGSKFTGFKSRSPGVPAGAKPQQYSGQQCPSGYTKQLIQGNTYFVPMTAQQLQQQALQQMQQQQMQLQTQYGNNQGNQQGNQQGSQGTYYVPGSNQSSTYTSTPGVAGYPSYK